MKSVPKDKKLYNTIKKKLYIENPVHSAYRSGILVQRYKKAFKLKYPRVKDPYSGQTSKVEGLSRWFKENWKSDTNKYRYTSKSSVYRPTKRITKKTPKTFSELSNKELQQAKRKKAKHGRVNYFEVYNKNEEESSHFSYNNFF